MDFRTIRSFSLPITQIGSTNSKQMHYRYNYTSMKRETAIPYIGHHVDNALSTDPKPVTDQTRLVGWQCGFEPLFVAVHDYLGGSLDDDDAIELATDLLSELGWFSGDSREPDFIL